MVQISLQNSGGKMVFCRWVPKGVKVPWSLLSDQGTQITSVNGASLRAVERVTLLTLKSVNKVTRSTALNEAPFTDVI